MIKKILLIISMILILSGCKVTYNYYTLDNLEYVNWVVNSDATLNSGKEITQCVGVGVDSTGHTVYLMKTINK